jgi:hypothetical protein
LLVKFYGQWEHFLLPEFKINVGLAHHSISKPVVLKQHHSTILPGTDLLCLLLLFHAFMLRIV